MKIDDNVILQEIIEGPDSGKRVYLSCYDVSGKRIANAMLRELRCDPLGFGPASVTEPIVDREVDEICDRWLRSLGYVGICEIEIKQDTRDGRFKLIEANPRLSGSGDAAPYAGVDLVWLHYLRPHRASGVAGRAARTRFPAHHRSDGRRRRGELPARRLAHVEELFAHAAPAGLLRPRPRRLALFG